MPATRARYRVVALATTLAMVTYLDRVAIGTLAPGIRRDLGLTAVEMGWVFTAFQFAYGLFEVPTGRWADRVGTRSVVARIVIWWSALTVATAAAFNYPVLLAVRFLFGAGEAGAWPCVARTFSRWIPRSERGRAQGIFFAGAHLVAGLTPGLIVGGGLLGSWWPGMLSVMSWRGVFVTFGLVGVVWVAVWLYWFRNDPSEHPAVNAEELDAIVAGRPREAAHPSGWAYWRELIRSRNMIALSVMYIPNCMIFYFCITWLPTYLLERHGFNISGMALFAGLPLLVSMPGDLLGGWLTDHLCSRYGLRVGRCVLGGRRLLRRRPLPDCRRPRLVARRGGRPDCHRHGPDDVHAGRGMGDGNRDRRQPRGRRRRHDELHRQPRRDAQPAHRRLLG